MSILLGEDWTEDKTVCCVWLLLRIGGGLLTSINEEYSISAFSSFFSLFFDPLTSMLTLELIKSIYIQQHILLQTNHTSEHML
jgi:hypothetical protein